MNATPRARPAATLTRLALALAAAVVLSACGPSKRESELEVRATQLQERVTTLEKRAQEAEDRARTLRADLEQARTQAAS